MSPKCSARIGSAPPADPRRLGVGFQRASRLVEAMTTAGILGPHCGDRPRKVLIGEVKDRHVEELYDAAVKVVSDCGRGSGSELQRRLHIGYAIARRLIERMTAAGILGSPIVLLVMLTRPINHLIYLCAFWGYLKFQMIILKR